MNAEHLLTHFDRLTDAPDAIPRLRRFILDLAVRGKLVEQDPEDEPAAELLKRITKDFSRQVAEGKLNKPKPVKPLSAKEGLFSLPRGWAVARFNQVAAIQSNLVDPKRYKALPHIAPDNIESWTSRLLPYVSVGEAGVHSGKHLFSAGAILYSKIRPNLAKVAKVSFDGLCSADMYPIHVLIDCDFLVKFMITESFVAQAVKEDNRVAMPKINQSALSDIVVPVPPLAEQHRIVAKVDELMALCDRLETARTEREATRDRLATASLTRLNAPDPDPAVFQNHAASALNNLTPLTTRPDQIKALRQTILNLAVRGKLVEQDPEDEPAGELLRRVAGEKAREIRKKKMSKPEPPDSLAFELPAGWAAVRFSNVLTELQTGPFGSSLHQNDYEMGGTPVINPASMRNGRIVPVEKMAVGENTLERLATFKLRAGDIVMGRRGEMGRCAVVTEQEDGWLCGTGSLILRLSRCLYPEYLAMLIGSPYMREYLGGSAVGTTMQNLNQSILLKMSIGLPPLAEQRRIVVKVDELMTVCDRLEASLAAGEETRGRLVEAVLRGVVSREMSDYASG